MKDETCVRHEAAGAPACDRCGSDEAHAVGEGHLCAECFQLAGSSCGGGGIARDLGGQASHAKGETMHGPAGTC